MYVNELLIAFNGVSQRWKSAKGKPAISVLPVLSKVMERHVHTTLYDYLCEHKLNYCTARNQVSIAEYHITETALIRSLNHYCFC